MSDPEYDEYDYPCALPRQDCHTMWAADITGATPAEVAVDGSQYVYMFLPLLFDNPDPDW